MWGTVRPLRAADRRLMETRAADEKEFLEMAATQRLNGCAAGRLKSKHRPVAPWEEGSTLDAANAVPWKDESAREWSALGEKIKDQARRDWENVKSGVYGSPPGSRRSNADSSEARRSRRPESYGSEHRQKKR